MVLEDGEILGITLEVFSIKLQIYSLQSNLLFDASTYSLLVHLLLCY